MGPDVETFTEIVEGNCERGMEVGMWVLGRLEIPANILIVDEHHENGGAMTVIRTAKPWVGVLV